MPKRSITDPEIALIKAMLARGMKNKNIQFFFNRPDRAVNSGRITQIGNGSYGPEVPAASDAELDAFIAKHRPDGSLGAVSVPSAKVSEPIIIVEPHPLDDASLRRMFSKDAAGQWRLAVGETDRHECKENFGVRHWGKWVRAIAALANNKGGYVFFGVKDKDAAATAEKDDSYLVIGLRTDEFRRTDITEIMRPVRSALDPTPTVNCATLDLDGLCVGVLHVEPHPARPVIVRSNDTDALREGDIFFRYPGSSERVKYSDLRAILDERDAVTRKDVLPMIERLLSLGPSRALVADLDKGLLDDGKRPIVIDPSLVDQIKFIREGDFNEKDGAPTLRLVGDVTANGEAIAPRIVRSNINPDAVLRNFLRNETVADPMAYLLNSAHSNREWQPIWYYLQASGKTVAEAIALLQEEAASHRSHRAAAMTRLQGTRSALNDNAGRPRQLLRDFAAGTIAAPTDDSEAHKFALAVQGLPDSQDKLDVFRRLLLDCYDRASSSSSTHNNLKSAVFRAACRLDELLFRPSIN